jgi:hypothetical protein
MERLDLDGLPDSLGVCPQRCLGERQDTRRVATGPPAGLEKKDFHPVILSGPGALSSLHGAFGASLASIAFERLP